MVASKYAYIGRAACGCVLAMGYDDPNDYKGTARRVSEMIQNGLTIERVPVEEARVNWHCPHKQPENIQEVLL